MKFKVRYIDYVDRNEIIKEAIHEGRNIQVEEKCLLIYSSIGYPIAAYGVNKWMSCEIYEEEE
jgi:hypothetical protein